MTRQLMAILLGLSLAACSSPAPFGDGTGTDPEESENPEDIETDTGSIPSVLAKDLESFTYNAADETLTIRGISLDNSPFEETYRRRSGLDRGGYQAYTAQDGSLDRHSTAFVRDIRGTRAAIAVTGGQFTYFFAGGAYANSGNYSPPVAPGSNESGGLVTYGGDYVGLLNGPGDPGDLLPVAPGTEPSFLPTTAAQVTGRILINASFSDGSVNGTITNRQAYIGTAPAQAIEDLDLAPAPIAADGTFFGETSVGLQNRGNYGGIFGGAGATEVAGVVEAADHIDAFENEEELGTFVLSQCGQPDADPVCNQPNP